MMRKIALLLKTHLKIPKTADFMFIINVLSGAAL